MHRLEDVWADCRDEEEVIKLDFSQQIENLDLARIPDTMEDIDDVIHPRYYESNIVNTPLPAIQWLQKENKSISARFPPIMVNTNAWLMKKVIRKKKLLASFGDEEDDEGPVGKRLESRTKNKQDLQESMPIPSPRSKGKAPKYKFTVKGPKGGEYSFASQVTQQWATKELVLEEPEK